MSLLHWAVTFLVVSLVAGAFGFSGISAGASRIAKILFALFLVLAVAFFVALWAIGQAVT